MPRYAKIIQDIVYSPWADYFGEYRLNGDVICYESSNQHSLKQPKLYRFQVHVSASKQVFAAAYFIHQYLCCRLKNVINDIANSDI